jgi:glutamate formiminotransferase/formiminotetrahydrofolate cyclodeaminase
VKALGLEVDGQAQVSMNLVDTEQTPLHVVFAAVKAKANEAGIDVTWSEIIGLVPERVLFDASASSLKLTKFTADQVLERKVQQASRGGESVSAFVASVASSEPVPGGGSVAAHAGALAAALAQMVAALTIGKKKYAAAESEMREVTAKAEALGARLSGLVQSDADAYSAVASAYKLPKEPAEAAAHRSRAIQSALIEAAKIPLETCRACCAVADIARTVAAKGNTNAITDAGVCALLADAGCRGASYNVRINVVSLEDRSRGTELEAEATQLVKKTAAIAGEVAAKVENALA